MNVLRLAVLAAVTMLSACGGGEGILSDRAYRARVLADFDLRSGILARCDAMAVVGDPSLTPREREALQFLYAYMPLSDAVNYDGAYFLENVRLSEQTRREMPWGMGICSLRRRIWPGWGRSWQAVPGRERQWCSVRSTALP